MNEKTKDYLERVIAATNAASYKIENTRLAKLKYWRNYFSESHTSFYRTNYPGLVQLIDDSIAEEEQKIAAKENPDNKKESEQQIMSNAQTTNTAITNNMPEIKRDGMQIVLPPSMTLREAIKWLERKEVEDESNVAVLEAINGAYPFDGALAFMAALKEKYGWTEMVPTPGFFGSKPPTMVAVAVGPNQTVQVPWGRLQIPGIDGFLQTSVGFKDNRPYFQIVGEVKRKHKDAVAAIATRTRELIREKSIYRGKAIRVEFPEEEGIFDFTDSPEFMDLSAVREEELIFPNKTQRIVQDALFTPIERTESCRKYNIPRKRGILLAGPYGTGKSLTATVTAKKCEQNGWTFIYLKSVEQLQDAIYFAQQYSPAVIFAEDIDQVVSGERDHDMNDILNTIDGIDTKSNELIVVLTTNHLENINQALLRPGRLDAVINVRPPDREAVRRLVKLYSRGLLRATDTELDDVATKLDGQIPAFVRETVERAKLSAVTRLDTGANLVISAEDLSVAADSLLEHLELMKPRVEDERSDEEKAADRLGTHIRQAFTDLGSSEPQSKEVRVVHNVPTMTRKETPAS